MKFKIYLSLLGIISVAKTFACDFCGCYMGITPYDNQSSITVLYRYKSFSGYHHTPQSHFLFPSFRKTLINTDNFISKADYSFRHGIHGNTDSLAINKLNTDYEIYTTAEIRAKYFIHERIELNAILPYVMNQQRLNNDKTNISGIGDINLFAAYHAVQKIYTEKFQHRLIFGAGIKLPVGHYYKKNENNKRIDFILQPGTGSIDYVMYINYIFGHKKMGINLNSMYKFNGKNYYSEKIGNSTANYLNVFFKLRQDKNFKIFPSAQFYYEYSKGLFINNKLQEQTTMSILNAGLGLDMYYKNLAFNISFQLPVYEVKYESNMANTSRAMIGIGYNFNQLKYLIKSKKQE